MSHTNTVLRILQLGKPVTIAGLNRELNFQCNHPISTICELRRRGHSIADKWISNNGKRYKEYTLEAGSGA